MLLATLVLVFFSNTTFSAPDINPSPQDRIGVVGTIPEHVEAVAEEEWYTTKDSIFCKKPVGEAGFLPGHFSKLAKLEATSNGQMTWTVWRDELLEGSCGWALKEIDVYLDARTSGFPTVRASNKPTRVAYVCGAQEHCQSNWAQNDDSTKPTYHYCRFASVQPSTSVTSRNPCAVFNEKYRGTDRGKYEHILRQDQHAIQFFIIDLDDENP